MAMTNAERQAKLRQRRKVAGIGRFRDQPRQERLDLWVLGDRKWELEILASLQGMTIRETLENLIHASATQTKAKDPAAWSETALRLLDEARPTTSENL